MKHPKISAKKTGLTLGIFLVIYGLIYRYGELDRFPVAGWIFYLAIPFFMYRWYRVVDKTGLNFKNALKWTTTLSLIGNSIYTGFVYVFNKFFDDSLLQKTYTQGIERTRSTGASPEEIEVARQRLELLTTAELFSVIVFIQLMLFSLFCGLVYGFIVKKRMH